VRRAIKPLLAGVVVLAASALFYSKRSHIVASENERFERSFERIKQLDHLFNQDVLKVRFRMLEDYDSFREQRHAINASLHDLNAIPGFVDHPSRLAITRKIAELSRLLQEKDDLVETFKSQNAVLKNSLRYLPLAGDELIKRLDQSGADRLLESRCNEVLRQVLIYSAAPNDEQEQGIRSTLALIARSSGHLKEPESVLVGSVRAHAESILNRQPKVDALIRELVSRPVAQRIDELNQLFNAQFAAAVQKGEFYRRLLYVLCIVLFSGLVYTLHALWSTNRHLEGRTLALAGKNDQLQKEIVERNIAEARLEKTHRQLVESSRQAGMAEVATSVLHNVGNVLNSVNVSATLVSEQMHASKSANVPKIGAMLQEHADDPDFLTHNAKGRRIPGYLIQLGADLVEERKAMVVELGHLRKNIEHIKDIVGMQQNYAKVSGVAETVAISELVEDALRMSAAALARHGLEVVRAYQPGPFVTTERHKVLQILVNLIRNAKHACDDAGPAKKRVTVEIVFGEPMVRIIVSDNGVGIPPENLRRIFAHGFTTRKDGHGFGLHSGALAAKELGGSLTAWSDGPGKGAVFTLEIPFTRPTLS
jgi:two-component system NtrC family sensor kinase